MRSAERRVLIAAVIVAGCSGGASVDAGAHGDAATRSDASAAVDAGRDRDTGTDAAADAAGSHDAGPPRDPFAANRDRLLTTYLEYLRAHPDETQSNGLRGGALTSVCDLWDRLDPSVQAVFLTITARLEGSVLGRDGSTMLDHVTRLYRLVGGEGASATDPGSCGGGEYNRMIMSMDPALHEALRLANARRGARNGDGTFDLADIPSDGFWRDSHDLGGPHSPFDLSDETDDGAPRGQVHFFDDPTSALANAALGRMDLTSLVDPYALEMDQDYDCAHSSNPSCDYTFYGPACLPQSTELGLDIYTDNYGSVEPAWRPIGC